VTDTEDSEDDDDDDDDDDDNKQLADQVNSDPYLLNALRLQTLRASSSNDKSKQKSALKRGPLSAEAKQEICAFSTQVLGMAQDLANCLRVSRKNVLIAAGLGIKESRGENITNLYAQWYAVTHTKPDGSEYYCASLIPF
jgi:hypothetical protein